MSDWEKDIKVSNLIYKTDIFINFAKLAKMLGIHDIEKKVYNLLVIIDSEESPSIFEDEKLLGGFIFQAMSSIVANKISNILEKDFTSVGALCVELLNEIKAKDAVKSLKTYIIRKK